MKVELVLWGWKRCFRLGIWLTWLLARNFDKINRFDGLQLWSSGPWKTEALCRRTGRTPAGTGMSITEY